MSIRYASLDDLERLINLDKSLNKENLVQKISQKEVLVCERYEKVVGFLRFSYFWEHIPFMDLLYVDENNRLCGIGSELSNFWEDEMKRLNYEFILTSTQSDEMSQHFYRKIGYRECGCLLLPTQAAEIFFIKNI